MPGLGDKRGEKERCHEYHHQVGERGQRGLPGTHDRRKVAHEKTVKS